MSDRGPAPQAHGSEPASFPAPRGSTPSASGSGDFDWFGYLTELYERLYIPVLTLAAGLFAAYGYYFSQEVLYRATGTIRVDPSEGNVMNVEGADQEQFADKSALNTLMLIAGTYDFMSKVIENNELTEDPLLHGPEGKPSKRDLAMQFLTGSVRFTQRPNTYLIDVSVERNDPVAAQKIANSILEEVVRSDLSTRARASDLATDQLFRESQRLQEEVKKARQELLEFSQQYDAISLAERQQTLNERINEFEGRIVQARQELVQFQSDLELMDESTGDVASMLRLPSVKNLPTVSAAKQDFDQKEEQVAILNERYGRRHPQMILANTVLQQSRERLEQEVADAPGNLKSSIRSGEAKIKALEQNLATFKKEIGELSKSTIRYNVLEDNIKTQERMLMRVSERINETDIASGINRQKLAIVQGAILPSEPFSPNFIRIMALGAFGGLGAGLGLVFLIFRLDDSLKTVDQTEGYLNLPVLSVVPLETKSKSGRKRKLSKGRNEPDLPPEEKVELEIIHNSHGRLAESFRSLRASLTMLGNARDRQTFMVTSAVPAEGKTFCSVSCAIAFAQTGERVLLIDADMRRPRISSALMNERSPSSDPAKTPPGLTSFLTGQGTMRDVIRQSPVENLFVCTAGPRTPNPAELLGFGEQFGALVEEAKPYFHRIFVDTPPVHAVSDCLAIAPYIQTTFITVAAFRTSRRLVRKALRLVSETGNQPAGVVLNMVPDKSGLGYYYYNHYSYQQYGSYGDGGRNAVYGAQEAEAAEEAAAAQPPASH